MKFTVYRKHAEKSALAVSNSSLWTVRNRKCKLSAQAYGAKFLLTRRCNLYPYSITFDATGGTPSFSRKKGNVAQKIGDLPTASYGDKHFNGWYDRDGNQITANDVMSIRTKTCYASWTDPSVIMLNPNGGSITVPSVKLYAGIQISGLPTDPIGPEDQPKFIGWYTQPTNGVKVSDGDVFDGSFSTLYAHYSASAYSVDLNSQWFLDSGSGKDPKGNSYAASYAKNPDAAAYDGTYVSYSNFNVGSSMAKMRIQIVGYTEFTVYIRSYAESNYDYTVIGDLDQSLTTYSSSGKTDTRGSQTSGTSISNYKQVTYSNIDGGQHFIEVMFRKDGSVNSNQDRGYVLIPKEQ